MPKVRKFLVLFVPLLVGALGLTGCQTIPVEKPTKIAFLPDIHFHDVYGEFADDAFAGVATGRINAETGKPERVVLRTMRAQLNSTRLFNENYFVLHAALADIATQGIRLVALPGDFSDDGQPLNIRGLQRILRYYQTHHDMVFLLTTGNHDPVRPMTRAAGKSDFLGADGAAQAIYSHDHEACQRSENVICSDEVQELGYAPIIELLSDFGFMPQPDYLYWETPFSENHISNYDFDKALEAAPLAAREYEVCKADHCVDIPDVSYLVEPVRDVWLLSIDANVYLLEANGEFSGAGNNGYNELVKHKRHLLRWMTSVAERAEQLGKHLITFSHYPMTDFYHGQAAAISNLFGGADGKGFQLQRLPEQSATSQLAETGIRLHVAGHMHFNGTHQVESKGHSLVNVQAPSLAAYQPAYKVITLHTKDEVEITTRVLQSVPNFDSFFPVYKREHDAYTEQFGAEPWPLEILTAENYLAFTEWHLRELTRQRFLQQDWPADLRELFLQLSGKELALLLLAPEPIHLTDLQAVDFDVAALPIVKQLNLTAKLAGRESLSNWSAEEFAVDFYRVRNAGQLGLTDVKIHRQQDYEFLAKLSVAHDSDNLKQADDVRVSLNNHVREFLAIYSGLQQALPDDHFMLELDSGAITPMDVAR